MSSDNTNIIEYNKIKCKFIREYPDNKDYEERLNHELKIIVDKKFTDYILKIC